MIDEKDLRAAAARLAGLFDIERVILFGSQARGDADERSDVDFLVVCHFDGPRRGVMTRMGRALRGFPFARDIIVLTPEEFLGDQGIPGSAARAAVREGRVLYDRRATAA